MAWKLAQCRWRDRSQLDGYLKNSWEPFAATGRTDEDLTVWLRRSADPEEAGTVDLPRRPRHEFEAREG
jgi:hypothetical protein